MTRAAAATALALLLAGCGDDAPTVVMVTVDARPTLRPVDVLQVEVANAGGTISQDFELGAEAVFPRTFTVTPTGRTGDLTVTVEARDPEELRRGRGQAAVAIVPGERADVEVTLEPDDFVVNDGIVRTQWISFQQALGGRQLAVAPDSSFLVAWENDCPLSRCDILARLFDPTTLPAVNGTTMNAGDFIVNQSGDEYTETAALAAGSGGFLAAWLFRPTSGTTMDVKATFLAPGGAHSAAFDSPVTMTAEAEASPAALARVDGSYVVMWEHPRVSPATGIEVRARLFEASGTARGAEVAVSSAASGDATLPTGAGLAGGGFVVVWAHRNEGESVTNIRARVFGPDDQPTTALDIPISNLTVGTAASPYVAAMPDGGFVVGWQAYAFMDPVLGPQPLYVRRFSGTGAGLSTEIRVAERSVNYYASPVVAVRPSDGAVGVAWSDCGDAGDEAAGCGIWFRLLRAGGMPSGDPVVANTTRAGDQTTPSIAAFGADAFLLAWTDGSMVLPDTDGEGVRARVIYPVLERHDGQIGAECGSAGDAPCGPGLTCQGSPEGGPLCHPECTDACPGGGACVNGTYCAF